MTADGELTSARNRMRRASALLPLRTEQRYVRAMSRFGLALAEAALHARVPRRRWRLARRSDRPRHGLSRSAGDLVDRDARRRPADLPPRRSAGEDGHRDDGLRARGPLAAARPRAARAGGGAAGAASRSTGARRRSPCAPRCAGVVPDSLIDRAQAGLPGADGRVAAHRPARARARDACSASDARGRGYLRPDVVGGLLERHLAREEDNSSLLWSFLIFELWQRQVVDGRPSTERMAAAA